MNQTFYEENNPPTATATLVYALQAGSFLAGIPFIIGLIINYVKLNQARGTWVESHFLWQIRTFWWSVLWGVIGGITVWILIGYVILGLNFLWVIYRIIRGCTSLFAGRPMYV